MEHCAELDEIIDFSKMSNNEKEIFLQELLEKQRSLANTIRNPELKILFLYELEKINQKKDKKIY